MALQDTDNFIVGRGTMPHYKIDIPRNSRIVFELLVVPSDGTYVEIAGDNMTGDLIASSTELEDCALMSLNTGSATLAK